MMLDKTEVKAREEQLRLQVRALTDEQRKRFYAQFKERMKDPDTYAVLNYIFIAGLHHFYLGRVTRGLVNIAVFFAAVAMAFSGHVSAAVVVFIVITVLELFELFQSQAIVDDFNNRLMEDIIKTL